MANSFRRSSLKKLSSYIDIFDREKVLQNTISEKGAQANIIKFTLTLTHFCYLKQQRHIIKANKQKKNKQYNYFLLSSQQLK